MVDTGDSVIYLSVPSCECAWLIFSMSWCNFANSGNESMNLGITCRRLEYGPF